MTFLCFYVIKEKVNRLIIEKLRFWLIPVNFADINILPNILGFAKTTKSNLAYTRLKF